MSVREEIDSSIEAASHLTEMDAGAVATLRILADRVDVLGDNDWVVDGKLDNVSVPTFLRYCDALGLTPAGRKALELKKDRAGGKLTAIRASKSA